MTDHGVLYEVVITVSQNEKDRYLLWLREHMRAMLRINGFLSADLYADPENPDVFTCCYRLRDESSMKAYLDGPAAEMRADGIRRFGDKISAKRRILLRQNV